MNTFFGKNQRNTTGEINADAKIIYDKLKILQKGDIITYAEMAELISRSVNGSTSALIKAKELAQKEDKIVFHCIPKIGLQRLNDTEITEIEAVKPQKRMRSILKKSAKRLVCVDIDQLSNENKIKYISTQSWIGAMQIATKHSVIDTIQKHQTGQSIMATAEVLKLLAK